jgi:hypothetical protein
MTRVVRPNAFDTLVDLGITERKSLTLSVSPVLVASRDFWRGAMDGDGCIHPVGRSFITFLSSSSFAFINQFLAFLRSLDLFYVADVRTPPSGHDYYVVTLCGTSCLKLLKELYVDPCFAMERKKKLADACMVFHSEQRYRRRVVAV